jgi:hypothetical protein
VSVRETLRASVILQAIAIGLVLGLAQLLLAGVFAAGEAVGHARFHGLFAICVLVVAGAIHLRWRAVGWASRAPALGLVGLAAAQLVESAGAYGFDADNETRNAVAIVHDIGLALTPLGMVAAIIGLAAGMGVAASRGSGARRWAGAAASVVGLAGGILVVKTLMGM